MSTGSRRENDPRPRRVHQWWRPGARRESVPNLEVENELEFTVGRLHQITAGLSVARCDFHGDEGSNASGTYTFASLAAFEAGRPATFTQRVGDPTYRYSMTAMGGRAG